MHDTRARVPFLSVVLLQQAALKQRTQQIRKFTGKLNNFPPNMSLPEASLTTENKSKKVIVIVGAGLSGLCAAHELLKKDPHNIRVILLEADKRVGGRNLSHKLLHSGFDLGMAVGFPRHLFSLCNLLQYMHAFLSDSFYFFSHL